MNDIWVCFDFDGVCAKYTKFEGNDVFGEPVPGVADLIGQLRNDGVKISLNTTRLITPALNKWCDDNGFRFDSKNSCTHNPEGAGKFKPIASLYVDDNAYRFNQEDPKQSIHGVKTCIQGIKDDYEVTQQEEKVSGKSLRTLLNEGNASPPSGLYVHAKKELEKAGMFDEDSDYNGGIGAAVLDLVKTFGDQGHSGGSAGSTLYCFDKVANWKTLSPITDNPDEWREVGEQEPRTPTGTGTCWQSTRSPSLFSEDGGITYYDLDDPAFQFEENGVSFCSYGDDRFKNATIHKSESHNKKVEEATQKFYQSAGWIPPSGRFQELEESDHLEDAYSMAKKLGLKGLVKRLDDLMDDVGRGDASENGVAVFQKETGYIRVDTFSTRGEKSSVTFDLEDVPKSMITSSQMRTMAKLAKQYDEVEWWWNGESGDNLNSLHRALDKVSGREVEEARVVSLKEAIPGPHVVELDHHIEIPSPFVVSNGKGVYKNFTDGRRQFEKGFDELQDAIVEIYKHRDLPSKSDFFFTLKKKYLQGYDAAIMVDTDVLDKIITGAPVPNELWGMSKAYVSGTRRQMLLQDAGDRFVAIDKRPFPKTGSAGGNRWLICLTYQDIETIPKELLNLYDSIEDTNGKYDR